MSANGWPTVPLSEVATQVQRPVPVEPGEIYRTLGVKWWAEGAYERQAIDGSQTAARTLNKVEENDLIINKIWVRHGSVAVVTPEVAGCVGSNEFPTFEFHKNRILPRWFHWYSKTRGLWQKCDALSQGTSGKNRIRPERFLTIQVPLPPLVEQRRIVAKIDHLADKINEAQKLSNQSATQSELLAVAMAHRTDLSRAEKESAGWRDVGLGDAIKTSFDDQPVVPTEQYPNLGIYSYGRGLFPKQPIDGLKTSATRLRRVHNGQFIYSRLFAWEGAFGLVTSDYDKWYVSQEYPTFICDRAQILPEFLFAYFRGKHAWEAVAVGSKGLGNRRKRVQPDQILGHRLLLPPLDWQMKIKTILAREPEVQEQHGTLAKELDALLPSILDRAFKGEL